MGIVKINYKPYFLAIVIIISILFVVILRTLHKSEMQTINCRAELNAIQSDVVMTLSVYLNMDQQSTSHINITGNISEKDKKYKVSRSYTFNYEDMGKDRYRLTNLKLSKRINDNVPDPLSGKIIFNLNARTPELIGIKKTKKSYVIGDSFSPLFICVPRQ